ncbi:MAG: class I SAM-dependent rRNA methyltransferase [Lachnospiraceae bacterium]|jgi:23S rRNA (cytosine1962-C5)-methyltransferase
MYGKVILKKGEGRLLKSGGSWIFDNEIARCDEDIENGAVVSVADFDDYPMGVGVINFNSKIRVRMLSRNGNAVADESFWREKLKAAWEYRKKTVDTSSCRLVFGEADGIPGITVDKYEDVLVIQSLALGTDPFKYDIINILKEVLACDEILIKGVYERSDASERTKEGLEKISGFIGEPFDTEVVITENGVKYVVDVADGQKTGFFLDQKYNRAAIHSICSDARVLDCFTHTGSFALNAAFAGATEVTGIDASERAVCMARRNALLNGFDEERVRFIEGNVLDMLPEMVKNGEKYDVVILDPPAFAKSRANIKAAVKGYRKINEQGLRLVRNGGFFCTCSCSHFMNRELFEDMVRTAAGLAHVRIRQVECRTQAPDHPILWNAGETFYLKFYIFQVISRW